MPMLADLQLKKAYHKPEDDIASAFYLPAMAAAISYDRAVGFFSSSVYTLAWSSLKTFVGNGGKIRLICSPVLHEADIDAIRSGYSTRAEENAAIAIREELARMLASPVLARPAAVFASLIAAGVIDIQLAWVDESAGARTRRLFHDKVGILSDGTDHVVFKGSMNETWPGLARDGNLESVDVFVSWGGERERERIEEEQAYFDRLWKNDWPGVTTRSLPDSAREDIMTAAEGVKWPDLVDEICLEFDEAAAWSPEAARPDGRLPRQHQIAALEAWTANERRGILEHATASGKTFTAICAIHESLRQHEVPLILVPSDLLLKQWDSELRQSFGRGLQLLICGGGHSEWRQMGRLRSWTRPPADGEMPRAVLSTIQTAATDDFRNLVSGGQHLFLVADEVHRLGAERARRIFDVDSGPRLGLSATPRRAGDPEGTQAILDYFGGIIDPPFGIHEAIRAGTLTPYAYSVHTIELDADEQARWQKLTDQYRRLYARAQGDPDDKAAANLKQILIRRARIVKSASAKVPAAVEVLLDHYEPGHRWIVYCDDQCQLNAVRQAAIAAGVDSIYEYHSNMAADRGRTLDLFNAVGGIMVSIRCLDEGVDIPAVSHALILASSRNPREFIQRRGRVLRRAPGKWLAHIHDVIVVPNSGDEGDGASILTGEVARALEFGRHAINPTSISELERLAARLGLDWEALAGTGIEDDEDDEEALIPTEILENDHAR
jgi:superfamily II DNA or RNA helicase